MRKQNHYYIGIEIKQVKNADNYGKYQALTKFGYLRANALLSIRKLIKSDLTIYKVAK